MKKILVILLICIATFGGVWGIANAFVIQNEQQVIATASSVYTSYDHIKKVQTKLKQWGYYTGKVDGINGPLTVAAIKKFQRKYGLVQDGVAGPLTCAKMGITVSNSTSSSNYNNNDLYLLAKIVYSEARGEPYAGKVGVAAVCLNRVKDSRFPNTLSGVIYQPWAFTAIYDGQFNLEPDSTSFQAARDALNGWDPTYGSVYYYNPATATSSWIWSTKKVTTIGSHVFAV